MTDLTKRQAQVAKFIDKFTQRNGYAPSMRDIGEQFNMKSPNGVMCHLRALKKKGHLTWEAGKSRTLRLTRPPA